ncbi:MAG: hypothetical protein B7Z54_07845 [Sphingobacteriales bacterium 12-47-4]|nr:MAG: hypothetical protein B7Z54_07845 [Sphingobacteriales bacterium 12-47-4]
MNAQHFILPIIGENVLFDKFVRHILILKSEPVGGAVAAKVIISPRLESIIYSVQSAESFLPFKPLLLRRLPITAFAPASATLSINNNLAQCPAL